MKKARRTKFGRLSLVAGVGLFICAKKLEIKHSFSRTFS